VTPPHRPQNSAFIQSVENPPDEAKRPSLHPLEKGLIGITALHLCFLPWALGTMHVWSQLMSLGFAITGMVLAAWPRETDDAFSEAPRSCHWPAAQLPRWPVFWTGLAFLGYLVVQGLNPAWQFMIDADSWWLEPLDPITWLPSSVEAPFARSNSWRTLTVFSTLLLLVSSIWVGFTRRKSYYALGSLLATNAGLLALVGLAQRLDGTKQIFWSYVPSNASFIASFIYPNHAGPYFYLMAALAVGLAWWHNQRARKRLDHPGAAAAYIFVAACCCSLVVLSSSRMSILLLLAFILAVAGRLGWRMFKRTGPVRQRPEWLHLSLILAVLLGLGGMTLRTEKVHQRFAAFVADPATASRERTLTRQATGDMFRDHWFFGWGAGCFRYGFPKYTKKYPAIHYWSHGPRSTWEHAHNDLLEFPVELGVAGLLPLSGILGYSAWQLCRRRFWNNVVPLSLVLGCALVVVHAWVDFVFQNPAVLLTWSVLLAAALRWTVLDQPSRRRKSIDEGK